MTNTVWKIKKFDNLNIAELYAILKIRQEVFVVEQTCYYLDADGFDQYAFHIWAEKEGEVVAYCRVFGPNIKYEECSIGRVLTSERMRKKKAGKFLMKLAIETIESNFKTKKIRISAQEYLEKFYETFGFHTSGKKYLEDDIPHIEMIRG